MSPKERLVQLAKQDVRNAQDNLARARSAARFHDPTRQWGQSGETLNQIISGYEKWEQDALAVLAHAEAM